MINEIEIVKEPWEEDRREKKKRLRV